MAAFGGIGHVRGGEGAGLGPRVDGLGGAVAAAGGELEAAVLVHPVDLLGGEEHGGQRRRVVGLVLAAVVERGLEVERGRDPAARGGDALDALDGRRRHRGEPEATVRAQALLGGEVVHVGLGGVEAQAAGGRGGVDRDEAVGRGGALGATRRVHHARGRLVVGEGVHVDVGVGPGLGVGAGGRGDDLGLAEVGRGRRRGGELGRELTEGQVLAALVDEPEGEGVPEHRGAAVAEDDLVAVGQAEELGEAVAQRADHEADAALSVTGAEVGGGGGGEGGDGLGTDLGRAAAEAAVGGQQLGGDRDVERGGDFGRRRAHRVPLSRQGRRRANPIRPARSTHHPCATHQTHRGPAPCHRAAPETSA